MTKTKPLLVLLTLLALFARPLVSQIVSEDLPAFDVVEGIDEETAGLIADADQMLSARAYAEAIELLNDAIFRIDQTTRDGDPLTPQATELLVKSLGNRAKAHLALGDSPLATDDLDRLVLLDPQFEFDALEAGADLMSVFDRIKKKHTGSVVFSVIPIDATIELSVTLEDDEAPNEGGPTPSLDDDFTEVTVSALPGPQNAAETEEEVDAFRVATLIYEPGKELALLAGKYQVEIKRPGYLSQEMELEIKPGERLSKQAELDRFSAAMLIRTRPPGAQVTIDDVPYGETTGTAELEFSPTGDASRYPREDFSQPLWIDGIAPGEHRVEIALEGYRSFVSRMTITEARDYRFRPVLLERQKGRVLLSDLPSGATVRSNGQEVRVQQDAESGKSYLDLPPGTYQLTVNGPDGVFESRIVLEDKQLADLKVRLRRPVILVGVLGDDTSGATRLRTALGNAFELDSYWTLLDRSEQGPDWLSEYGATALRLRSLEASGLAASDVVDWRKLQSASDARFNGAAYALAVLDDDLVANVATLLFWPPAPGPSRPELRTAEINDQEKLTRIVQAFEPTVDRVEATLGALLIDSAEAAAPVIASTVPAGASALAGLRIGDEITALDGKPVFTSSEIEAVIQQHQPGDKIKLEIGSHYPDQPETRTVEIELGRARSALDLTNP